jgi:Holliday junction resolvase RusA-like endonuclease
VNNFEMPKAFFAVWFYIPFPKTWLRYKKKCLRMHGAAHESTPDWDNLTKALFDALMPRKNKIKGEKGSDDRKVHCGSTFKVWVRPEDACIKILEYDPAEYMAAFKDGHPTSSG